VRQYPSTIFTRTWTRESSNTRYEIANGNPAVDKFRLVTACCCWKCRWTTIVRSNAGTKINNSISGQNFNAPYTLTEIAFTGDPPVVTNGTSPITCSIVFKFPPEGSPKYCMNNTETGRSQAAAQFFLHGIESVNNSSRNYLDFSYTDGEGGSVTGGPTSLDELPTTSGGATFPTSVPIDGCVDLPSGFSKIDFVGDESAGVETDTSVISLKLAFAFT
jgi:hypothetical protein